MSDHRRDTSVLAAALGRDWPSALEIMQLPHDPADRVIKPPVSRHPATRILDDPRSLGQLFAPTPFQQVEALNGTVTYDGMDAGIQAARWRRNPAIDAADVQAHVVDQRLFSGSDWAQAAAPPPRPSFAFQVPPPLTSIVERVKSFLPWQR